MTMMIIYTAQHETTENRVIDVLVSHFHHPWWDQPLSPSAALLGSKPLIEGIMFNKYICSEYEAFPINTQYTRVAKDDTTAHMRKELEVELRSLTGRPFPDCNVPVSHLFLRSAWTMK